MSILHLNSYHEVIQQKLKEHAHQKGYKAHLSQCMGIQTSHFSQVLAGKIDLNPDQGAKLCDEWKFDDLESDYFINLIHLERATTITLKKRIKRNLSNSRLSHGLGNDMHILSPSSKVDYLPFFSSWVYPAVYGALKLKGMLTETDIAKRLEIPLPTVKSTFLGLESMKLIERQEGRWVSLKDGILNLSQHARAISQMEFRVKAHQMFVDGDTEMVRFSSMMAVTSEKYFEFRERVQKFVAEYHADTSEMGPPPEELIVLNVDFFRVGRPIPESSPQP